MNTQFLQVENALTAQTVLLADIQESHGQRVLRGKMVAVPVSSARRRETLRELTVDINRQTEKNIIRDEDFSRIVYSGVVRPAAVSLAFQHVSANQMLLDTDQDTWEDARYGRPRNLPANTFAPARGFRPANFLALKQPYSKTFPIFFPRGVGDVDDQTRNPQVSEQEWCISKLRCVKKQLAEFPLFVFAAAYRLDTAKIRKSYYNSASYSRSEDGLVTRTKGFNGPTLRGSHEYFAKKRNDIFGTVGVIGNPHFSFTVSCDPRSDVTLSTALSQDGYDVWHKKDEPDWLGAEGGFPEDYHVHMPVTDDRFPGDNPWDLCAYHPDCHRVPLSQVLEGMDVEELLRRNSYNVQRIFEHKVRAMVNNIILSDNNGLEGKVFHTVKEFAKGCPSGHAHGVLWRKRDETTPIFQKLHDLDEVTQVEMDRIVSLADSVVTTCLSADRLIQDFASLSPERCQLIVGYAARYQQHVCSDVCAIGKTTDGCQKHFPRLPSELTILTSPQYVLMTHDEAKWLVKECEKVKVNVRQVLTNLKHGGQLRDTTLVQVLRLALGEPLENFEDGSIVWLHGRFPVCEILRRWENKFRTDGSEHALLLGIYYASLSTSTWRVGGDLVYQLLLKREVAECFTVDYNPFVLEAMGSNMEFSLVVFTPHNLIRYITKEQDVAFSITKSMKELSENGEDQSLENVLKVIDRARKLSQPEAFYRVDNSLSLSETNLPAESICSDFPINRPLHLIPDQRGQVFNGIPGRYRHVPDMFSNYVHANR